MKAAWIVTGVLAAVSLVAAQDTANAAADVAPAASKPGVKNISLTDAGPLSVQHSLSFGMASGFGSSSLQSQSFYSTMLQYRFSAPVTLNLNFSLPIYSSFSPYQNLSAQNMQSLNYFKNIPFDVGLKWQPSDRLQFNFSIINCPAAYGYGGYGLYNSTAMPWLGR